jgi:protein-S-isoprenylcysteine O-methyltransferase Ste14
MTIRNQTSGRPNQRARKIALRLLLIGLILAMPFVQSPFSFEGLHQTLEIIGQFLIIFGIMGRAWCTMHIGGQKFTELVTLGPFSVSRNPLYVFSLIATFGAGLQTGSLLFAMLTAFGVWIILDATVRKEEVALRGRFGDAYEVYCARTPRYVPKITSWQGQDSVTVNMHHLYRTLLDGSLFFLIVPVAELIDRLQVVGYFPVLLKLPF